MNAHTILRPLGEARTYRQLLFLLSAAPLAGLWFGLLFAGWLAAGLLAVTPLLVLVLIGFRKLTWLAATAEARLARALLGVEVQAPRAGLGTKGYWGRIRGVLAETSWWGQQTYLLLRMLVGGPLAIAAGSAVGASLWWIVTPITYRWSDESFGSWRVDTLPRALLFLPAGLVGLIVSAWLIRACAAGWRRPARVLLGAGHATDGAEPLPSLDSVLRRSLPYHAAFFAVLNGLLITIWALTTRAYFWPQWTLLPLGLVLALHAWAVFLDGRALDPRIRALAVHVGSSAAVSLFLVAVWAVTTRAYFWPVWPILALALVAGIHATVVLATRGDRAALARRIDALTASRAGAVTASEAELRRIERDLHDGAQARLVALGMSLGMAEQKLESDPDAARHLLAEARAGAHEALKELRDLARGIHPPVLADRGLGAALTALAARSPLPVEVSVDVPERPAAAVETAAYFVAAEALANATKHAQATRIRLRVTKSAGSLSVEVADDGRGGADAGGPGLRGIRQRVEVLDGTLHVTSPRGGPTIVKAVLPCAS
jgi:signal transduction histidine kinase